MTSHVLACVTCGSGGSLLNGLGTFIVWGFLILCGLAFLAGIPVAIVKHLDARRSGLPPEPSNVSPGMASLLSGRNVASYTAPVRAVTPRGDEVRASACCARGHQSPRQAADHAAMISQRIAMTGR